MSRAELKRLAGRPGVYHPKVHPRLAYLIMAHGGFSQDELAKILDVPRGTFLSWIHRYPAFHDAVVAGRDYWNCEKLEKTLYQKATGYEIDEVEVSRVPIIDYEYDDRGKPCQVVTGYEMKETKRVTKHVQPDTTSLLFVLQNRLPDRWKNTRYVKVDTNQQVNHAHVHLGIAQAGNVEAKELDTEKLKQLTRMAQEVGILPDPTKDDNVQEAEVVD